MDISRLAAKQKRLKNWEEFCSDHYFMRNGALRETYLKQLKSYKELLAKLWKSGSISESDEIAIRSTERSLEELNEKARMTI